jgi:gliding motility-associated-like protein
VLCFAFSLFFEASSQCNDSTNAAIKNPFCFGDSSGWIKLSMSDTGNVYSYAWSNGDTTDSIFSLHADSFFVTITDTGSCLYADTFVLIEPTQISITPNATDLLCFGDSSGFISLNTSGGAAPYSYSWSNGDSLDSIYGLRADTFSVIITDTNNCTFLDTFIISENDSMYLVHVAIDNLCGGDSSGSINVNVIGGSPSYAFSWSNGDSISNIDSLISGVYFITVTDSIGCIVTDSFSVSDTSDIVDNAAVNNVDCYGNANGWIKAFPSGGLGQYSFLWNNSSPIDSIGSLNPGSYSLTISDSVGCSDSFNYTITEPLLLQDSVASQDIFCVDSSTGSIEVIASGGMLPYSYSWSNGDSTALITGLSEGGYTYTLTDSNGCALIGSISLETLQDSTTLPDSSSACNGGPATLNPGSDYASYIWSTGDTVQIIYYDSVGTYYVSVTDTNSCFWHDSSYVGQGTANITQFDTTICLGDSLTISEETPGLSYNWSTAETTQSILVKPSSTSTYSVVVHDGDSYCSDNVTITLNIVDIPDTSKLCNLDSFALNAGSNFANFAWSTGDTNQVLMTYSTGQYSITATDAYNCVTEDTGFVSFVYANIFQNDTMICLGDTIIANAFFDSLYLYSWNNSSTSDSSTLIPTSNQSYIVTVTNGVSVCTDTINIGISAPAGSLNDTTYTCASNNNTIISAGAGYSSYLWSTTETTDSIVVAVTNDYYVTITDSLGCLAYDSTYFDFLATEILQIDTTICYNDSILLNTNASFSDNLLWSNGDSASSVSFLSQTDSSIYLTVTNHGATCVDSVHINISFPKANLTDSISFCADSSIIIYADSGHSSYAWSNGDTLYYSTALSSGMHYVSITDSLGCTNSDSSILINSPITIINMIADSVDCFGGNTGSILVNVSSGTSPYSYFWDSAVTNITLSGAQANYLISGIYYVTVVDSIGCGNNDSVYISQPSSAVSSILVKSDASCMGYNDGNASITSSGGTAPYQYTWSGGIPSVNGDSVSALGVGTYFISVTDSALCVYVDTLTIVSGLNLSIDLDSIDVLCYGFNTGSISSIINGGAAPYSYTWNNSSTDTSIQNLMAGVYILTISDSNNCMAVDSIVVNQPDTIQISFNTYNSSCYSFDDAKIKALITGGVPSYNYIWSTNEFTDSISALSPGLYNLSITDANNCLISDTIRVTEPDEIITSMNIRHPSCYNSTNGMALIAYNGGTGPLTHIWNSGTSLDSIYNKPDGTYTVIVTDSTGCSVLDTAILIEPSALAATTSVEDLLCFDVHTGKAWVNASGGTTPYSYFWSNNKTSDTIENLYSSLFFVTVTDSNGCSINKTAAISQPTKLNLLKSSYNNLCNGDKNGYCKVVVSGGVSSYSYNWSNNATSDSIGSLAVNTYIVTITDANSCELKDSFIITEPDTLNSGISKENVSCHGLHDGFASVSVTGGIIPHTYHWNNSYINPSISNLYAGSYIITITDGNNCTFIDSVYISEPDEISIDTTNRNVVNVDCINPLGSISNITAIGGTKPYDYNWFDNDSVLYEDTDTTNAISGLLKGKYFVVVTDSNGCMNDIGKFFISETLSVGASIDKDTIDLKYGFSDTVNAYGGDNYLWIPEEGIDCDSCATIVVSSNETRLYYLYAGNNTSGCIDTLRLFVKVSINPELYIPTAFTPNDDGKNDVFRIYGTYIEGVYYEIYDRWGELMFIGQSTEDYWDGTFRGEKLNGSTFIVRSKITFIDGSRKMQTSKIRLMR